MNNIQIKILQSFGIKVQSTHNPHSQAHIHEQKTNSHQVVPEWLGHDLPLGGSDLSFVYLEGHIINDREGVIGIAESAIDRP